MPNQGVHACDGIIIHSGEILNTISANFSDVIPIIGLPSEPNLAPFFANSLLISPANFKLEANTK